MTPPLQLAGLQTASLSTNRRLGMTPHQTLAVAVRLFAIWFAIYVAREMLGLYVSGRERGDPYSLAIVATLSIVAVLFLVALWLFPKTIARGLLAVSNDAP